jgi:hypothetical protein
MTLIRKKTDRRNRHHHLSNAKLRTPTLLQPVEQGRDFPRISFHSLASLTPDFHSTTRKSSARRGARLKSGLKEPVLSPKRRQFLLDTQANKW